MKTFLAWLFGCVVSLRNMFFEFGIFRAKRLPGQVISIGNIAVGGTGKSPLVVATIETLMQKGLSCAVLTRGYKGGLGSRDWLCLVNGLRVAGDAPETARPDEAIMQSRMLRDVPILVGAKRSAVAEKWLREVSKLKMESPQCWILDDGFQHRQIYRDLDIVALDADRPFGRLLPLGLFREPAESLQRAHAIVFTRCSDKSPKKGDLAYPTVIAPSSKVFKSEMIFSEPVLVCGPEQRDLKFCAVAGIARPASFLAGIKSKSLEVVSEYFEGDHEPIESAAMELKRGNATAVITTEKDWARSEAAFRKLNMPVYLLPMKATFPVGLLDQIRG